MSFFGIYIVEINVSITSFLSTFCKLSFFLELCQNDVARLSSFCVLTFSLLFIMNERKEAFLREFWALIWNLIFTQSLVSTILSAAIENVSIFSLILSLSLSHSHMLSLALYVSLSIFLSHFVSSSFCLSFYLSRSRMTNVLHRCASYVLSLLVIGTMPRDENGEEKIWDEKTEERKPNEMQGQCALDR